jgi:hypothetical protein
LLSTFNLRHYAKEKVLYKKKEGVPEGMFM